MGRLIAAGQMFWLEVRVYMVKVSYGQKPYRRSMMQTWAAEVFASPSMETNSGRAPWRKIRTIRIRSVWLFPRQWKMPLRAPTPTTLSARC